MTKPTQHKEAPVLPGENPTIEEHRINTDYLGTAYALSRATPRYMPSVEKELINWIDQYISTANANRMAFPDVFNKGVPYSVFALVAMRERLDEAYRSLDVLPGTQRAVTAFKNIVLFNRDHGRVAPPLPEAGWIPPTAAVNTGLVASIAAQVALLRTQPGFNEVLARQFGILPTPAPSVDPATLDPAATARFTGGVVELAFRSPRGIRGVEMAEIRCDRGDGHVHLVGTTTHARFTDHHDLPAANVRTTWTYWVCFVDRDGTPVGQQSVCDVTVQGRVG